MCFCDRLELRVAGREGEIPTSSREICHVAKPGRVHVPGRNSVHRAARSNSGLCRPAGNAWLFTPRTRPENAVRNAAENDLVALRGQPAVLGPDNAISFWLPSEFITLAEDADLRFVPCSEPDYTDTPNHSLLERRANRYRGRTAK